MSGQLLGQLIMWLILAVIVIAIIYVVMNWLYRRSTKEIAFVRTGFLGEKVVIDGGAFVWPIVHDITPVNMNTLPLEIVRNRETALISKDRMRVDVEAEFYVRVRPTREAVSIAASTLGRRTLEAQNLHALLAGKFESALRAISAEMTMEEMHEQRAEYVNRVRDLAQEGLSKNGLELESVAIKDIDQTELQYFNPSNRFDAEGLTSLIQNIESKRKLRNDIEQDSIIQIRTRNLQAEKQSLEIERASEEARLEQERDVEFRRALQRAQLARERAERDTEAESAQISARETIEKNRISNDHAIAEARISAEGQIRQREIEKQRTIETAEIVFREEIEKARILQEGAVAEARIANERDTQSREIERQSTIQQAEIAAKEVVDRARIDQEMKITEARIKKEQDMQTREIARQRTIDESEIAARQATDTARIAQERKTAGDRIASEQDVKEREIARTKALNTAEIQATEEIEKARIEQQARTDAERISADRETRSLQIERDEAIETADIRRRDSVERERISLDLALEKDRIASAKEREVWDIERKRDIEEADEDRVIELAGKKAERAEADARVRRAEITAQRDVETTEIAREKSLETARLERRRAIEQLEIARVQVLREAEIASKEEVERARIASERGLDEARIAHERDRRRQEVDRELQVETAQMEKAISLYKKSLEESAARAEADIAKAHAAEAEEQIITTRQTEEANRRRSVDLVMAEKNAQEKTIAAQAEKVRRAVEAEAQKLLNEAENVLTDEARFSLFRRKLLEHVEGIVAASVKPLEKINDIRIMQLGGMGGSGDGGFRNPTDEVIESALRYRVQAPLIDNLLADIGIEGGSLSKMGGLIREASDLQRVAKDAGGGKGAAPKPAGSGDTGGGAKPDAKK